MVGLGQPLPQELWAGTPDYGLSAVMYAPCEVTAKVTSKGTSVTVTESTGYPFTDTVTLSLSLAAPTAFPLYLRVPGWCSTPSIQVNGQSVAAPAGPAYTTISRVNFSPMLQPTSA